MTSTPREIIAGLLPNIPGQVSPGPTADAILEALSAAGMPVMEWRDIESAPRDGTPVWAYVPTGYQVSLIFFRGQWRQAANDKAHLTPTHWMPLPTPPKAAEE